MILEVPNINPYYNHVGFEGSLDNAKVEG